MIKTRIAKNINCRDCTVKHLCIGVNFTSTNLDYLNNVIKMMKQVAKKEYVYLMNTPILNIYAIYRGSCKEYLLDENGNERITNFYFPGDIIGIESISSQTYLFSMQALEETELCVIPIKDFLELITQAPEILKRFIAITNQKMQHDQLASMSVTANEKVCDFLLNITMRSYERNPEEKEISLTMPQVDIANYLGIAAETINRIFNILKQKKIISLKNKTFEIIDVMELRKLVRFNTLTRG